MARSFLLALIPALGLACSTGDTVVGERPDGGDGLTDTGTPGFDIGPSDACACSSTEVCVGGACCAEARVCGDRCCGGAEACSFGACVAPGAPCVDSSDCAASDYCDLSKAVATTTDGGPPGGACTGSKPTPTGRCLPRPPRCTGAATDRPGITCVEACEVTPKAGPFDLVVKYGWPAGGGQTTAPFQHDVMMSPIVVQLDDDDCDGKVDERDRPDIVFTTFRDGKYATDGVVHAVTVSGGSLVEKWSYPGVPGYAQLAGAELDGKPGAEVVACGADGRVHAIDGTGKRLWVSAAMSCLAPAIADLDADGIPEIVVEGGILDGRTGATKASFKVAPRGSLTVADVDGDGKPEIVSAYQVFRPDGSVVVDIGGTSSSWGSPVLVDLDADGKPEIAFTAPEVNQFGVWRPDASDPAGFRWVRKPFAAPVNPGGAWAWSYGMGPITSADFDGDGVPDFGFAAFRGYAAFSGKKLLDATLAPSATILWTHVTAEDNGSTGSAVFDFDGDGKAEVLYNDSERLHVYDGATGVDRSSICNTSGTVWEYPVVADVDGDGVADIIVGSNAFSNGPGTPSYRCDGTVQAGLRVFGSKTGGWVRTRRVWNQHSYHVTNVGEDGRIPKVESINWKTPGLNNFRQNKQPGKERAAPNAVVSVVPECTSGYVLRVTVRNVGEAALAAGVGAEVYKDGATPGLLGLVTTTRALGPAEAESLLLPVSDDGVRAGGLVFAKLIVPSTVVQCRDTDDVSPKISGRCGPR